MHGEPARTIDATVSDIWKEVVDEDPVCTLPDDHHGTICLFQWEFGVRLG